MEEPISDLKAVDDTATCRLENWIKTFVISWMKIVQVLPPVIYWRYMLNCFIDLIFWVPKEKIEGAARVARHSLTPTENGGIESTTSDVCSDAEFDTRRLIKCVSIPHALFISVDFAHFSPSSAKAASSRALRLAEMCKFQFSSEIRSPLGRMSRNRSTV